MRGVIISIMREKGFGFLRGEDGVSRFVHAKEVAEGTLFDLLKEKDTVTFTHQDHKRGPRAVNVSLEKFHAD